MPDRQLDWVHALFQLGQELSLANTAAMRQKLLDHITVGFDAHSGSIAVLDDDGQHLTLIAGTGAAANFIGAKIPLGERVLGWVAKYREAVCLNGDVANDPRFKEMRLVSNPGRPISALCWPLLVDSHVIGALSINRPAGAAPFTPQDVTDGAVMIGLVSLVVDNLLTHDRQRQHEAALLQEKDEQRALILKLQEAQGQLLQSEKMASVGQLAAGVAHEINNPVGFVNSNLGSLQNYVADLFKVIAVYEQLEPKLPQGDALQQLLALKKKLDLDYLREDTGNLIKESIEGLGRVKKIVQDLKEFSHVDSAEWQIADLHCGLDSTLNIAHNELKYKITVIKEYGVMPQVECIASQINQVFMNMLVNAAHAIETRGTITLRTGQHGDNAWIEITDTGKGMSAEVQKHIFEPFFTTKPVGKGTGLGLSLAYGIVQKHHGHIEVESAIGKGTRFRIHLPIRQPEKQAAA